MYLKLLFQIWKQFPVNTSVRQFHIVLSKICFLRTQNFSFWILPLTSNTEIPLFFECFSFRTSLFLSLKTLSPFTKIGTSSCWLNKVHWTLNKSSLPISAVPIDKHHFVLTFLCRDIEILTFDVIHTWTSLSLDRSFNIRFC